MKNIGSLMAATRADRVLLATTMLGLAAQLAFGNGRLLANVLIVGITAAVLARRDVWVRVAPLWRALPVRSRWVVPTPAVVLFLATPWPGKVAFGITVLSVLLTVVFVALASTDDEAVMGETN